MIITKYVATFEGDSVEYFDEIDCDNFIIANPQYVKSSYDEDFTIQLVPKTAKDYKNFADEFFMIFSQDSIDAGNTVEINDALELHFEGIFNALMKGRLDKVYPLLLSSNLLEPFYTQDRKDKYVALLETFLNS